MLAGRRTFRAVFMALSLAAAASAPAQPRMQGQAEARLALVIGNGSYPNVPLKNPPNDAADLAEALEGLGFSVTLVVDGDLAAMNRAIRDFGNAIKRPDAVALFYYSGHGVQYRGTNYLIPARADIQEADELPYSAVNAEQVYAKMESAGARTNIIVLDACRNNPFPGAERAGERGLAVVGNVQPPQSIIVYATAPGKTAQDGEGRNGAFTTALLRHLGEPGLDVELMIRKVRADVIAATGGAQVPWHNSSISGEGFSFAKALPAAPAPAAIPAQPLAAAAPGPGGGAGVLSFASEPPGIEVSVDGGDARATPFSVEVAPGAHSFEPMACNASDTFFLAEPKQWITVAAGAAVEVPIRPKAARARLALRLVPPGWEVFVNGESAGTTPLDPVEVRAGRLDLRFERPGFPPATMVYFSSPDQTVTASWGGTPDQAVELERRTPKLDGKPDSWSGLQPIWELAAGNSSSFLRQEEFGVRRIYLCKDDKYLYWRVDFNGANPLSTKPKGAGAGVTLMLNPWMEGAARDFNMTAIYNFEANKVDTYLGSYDGKAQSWSKIADRAFSAKQAKTMFAARLELKWVEKYCTEPGRLEFILVNHDESWNWDEASKFSLRLGYVDFLK